MKYLKVGLLVILTTFIASCNSEHADIIFVNGPILTMEQEADSPEALAVKDGKIVAVGTEAETMKHKGSGTEIIDLAGKTLMPGFVDPHSHFATSIVFTSGMVTLYPEPFGNVMSVSDIGQAIRAYIKEKEIEPGTTIMGWGYDDSVIGEHPTKEYLDSVAPGYPIYVIHTSGHLGVGNSLALEKAGINKSTPNPEGGFIIKNENGEPTGLLEENANIETIAMLFEMPGIMDIYNGIKDTQKVWLKYGQTTASEARVLSPKIWSLLKVANTLGLLDVDVIALPDYDYYKDEMDELKEDWSEYNGRLRVGGIKFSQDGSPQGKTAWLTKPYVHPPHGLDSTYVGYPIYADSVLKNGIARVLKTGLTFHTHNNGDAAIDQLIRILEELKAEGKYTGNERVALIHGQTMRADQIPKLKALGVIPSFYSLHPFAWGDWHRTETLGEARAARISPTASALREGLLFTIHHDAPVVPPDMITLLWSTVNRITRSGHILGEEQISAYEALKAITINSAYQWGEEDRKGTLTVGKLADLIVLSENPVTMKPTRLNELKVLKTFKEGELLYELGAEK